VPHVTRSAIICVVIIATIIIDALTAPHMPVVGNVVTAVMFFGFSAYCIQNFLRCREVHCAITGPGFLAAGILELLRLFSVGDIADSLPWIVFVGSYLLGMAIELAHGARTN
jgi:hypothetical protein